MAPAEPLPKTKNSDSTAVSPNRAAVSSKTISNIVTHEMSKALAHEAMERNLSLYEVASQAETIASYWAKFTDSEKELMKSFETQYTGLVA